LNLLSLSLLAVVLATDPAPAAAPAAAEKPAPPAAAPAAAEKPAPPAAVPAAAEKPAAEAAPRHLVNRLAATVNGEVVTQQELEQRAGEEWKRAGALPAGTERDRALAGALRRAFDGVVAEKLFHAQAGTLQIEITDDQVVAAIEDIKKRNNANDTQLDQMLTDQGLSRATFREQLRGQLESYAVLSAKVRSKVKVTDEDVQNYYRLHPGEFAGEEELHVRHLLLPLPEGAGPAEVSRAQAEGARVLERLAAGESFAEVAKAVSKGPGAAEGGDLGWLRRGTMQRSLEEVVFALKDGQVSKLFRAGPGLHLFKVEERRSSGGRGVDDVKDEIRDRLTMDQTQAYREQFIGELKRDAVIDVKIPELKD
jgi:peptidyl-prolyl cis-trans isomerase SurA